MSSHGRAAAGSIGTMTADRRRRWCSLIFLLSLPALSLAAPAAATTKKKSLESLDYVIYPQRTTEEAAVVEWGHSAVISALDGSVATFGPQTSLGAFFEVEASPVLAEPVDGVGKTSEKKKGTKKKEAAGGDDGGGGEEDEEFEEEDEEEEFVAKPLKNADEVHGNMVVMTNTAGLSGVQMASIAKSSGAAALMVVNLDQENQDFIWSLEPEDDDEAEYAERNIDIPTFMVSMSSANILTSATVTKHTKPEDIVNNGMPDRVRLYAAGDRPFFEDVLHAEPTVYLIHNLLTEDECDAMMKSVENKLDRLDNTVSNVLENALVFDDGSGKTNKIDSAMLWRGSLVSHSGKEINERIQQVTGFPVDHMSDFQINRHRRGSYHAPHYDDHPVRTPMASIVVFLDTLDYQDGGEFVFPNPTDDEEDPIKIHPTKGMGIVYHNTDEEGNFDPSTLHAELEVKGNVVKHVAKRWIYMDPLPPSRRIALPLIAAPFGGKLPRVVVRAHDMLVEKFGLDTGTMYFDKLCVVLPILVLFGVASVIGGYVKDHLVGNGGGGKKEGGKTGKKKKETKPSGGKKATGAKTKKTN